MKVAGSYIPRLVYFGKGLVKTYIETTPSECERRYCSDAASSQGSPRIAGNHQSQERSGFLSHSRRDQSCQYRDFRLLSSRTLKKKFMLFSVIKFLFICYDSTKKNNTLKPNRVPKEESSSIPHNPPPRSTTMLRRSRCQSLDSWEVTDNIYRNSPCQDTGERESCSYIVTYQMHFMSKHSKMDAEEIASHWVLLTTEPWGARGWGVICVQELGFGEVVCVPRSGCWKSCSMWEPAELLQQDKKR